MSVEAYLDYNKIIKAIFEITDEGIEHELELQVTDAKLGSTIIENLKKISSFEPTEDPDIYRFAIGDTIFIDVSKSTGEIHTQKQLTAFETRRLAQSQEHAVPFSREIQTDFSPKTDLHTHFAGAIRTDTLIEIGKMHDLTYPANMLEEMGINVSLYPIDDVGGIKLNEMRDGDITILKDHLFMPQVTQETFRKMETRYRYRGPFTKHKELFPEYLRALAEDYQKSGVEYADLSFYSIVSDPEYMKMLEEHLPQIEAETGVNLKFIIGLSRDADKEWSLDDIDRVKSVARSPYVVGCDFMGHEMNQSLDFEEELQVLARYVMEEDPDFVIRVHAGESPVFKTNVYDALKTIKDAHDDLEASSGKTYAMPQVRIGHGLYGMDIDCDGKYRPVPPNGVFDLIVEMGAIIEFNMSSNLALNNINDISDVPIKKYLEKGVEVVLGTDGHGMYSTSRTSRNITCDSCRGDRKRL